MTAPTRNLIPVDIHCEPSLWAHERPDVCRRAPRQAPKGSPSARPKCPKAAHYAQQRGRSRGSAAPYSRPSAAPSIGIGQEERRVVESDAFLEVLWWAHHSYRRTQMSGGFELGKTSEFRFVLNGGNAATLSCKRTLQSKGLRRKRNRVGTDSLSARDLTSLLRQISAIRWASQTYSAIMECRLAPTVTSSRPSRLLPCEGRKPPVVAARSLCGGRSATGEQHGDEHFIPSGDARARGNCECSGQGLQSDLREHLLFLHGTPAG